MRYAIPVLVGAMWLGGCGMGEETPLFDARSGTTQRNHFVLVNDPFGGPEQAGRGTKGTDGLQTMALLNEDGFFAMPSDREEFEVVLRLGVRGERDVRIVLVASGAEYASYRRTLPGVGRWCDLTLPLTEASRIADGSVIHGITVWQRDTSSAGRLYVQKGWVRRIRGR